MLISGTGVSAQRFLSPTRSGKGRRTQQPRTIYALTSQKARVQFIRSEVSRFPSPTDTFLGRRQSVISGGNYDVLADLSFVLQDEQANLELAAPEEARSAAEAAGATIPQLKDAKEFLNNPELERLSGQLGIRAFFVMDNGEIKLLEIGNLWRGSKTLALEEIDDNGLTGAVGILHFNQISCTSWS